MEQDKLDDLFKKILADDTADLNASERATKEDVWDRLDIPTKEQKDRFHFWKIAATILFLLLGGTAWMMNRQLNRQEANFAKLQTEFKATQSSLQMVKNQLQQKDEQVAAANIASKEKETPKEVLAEQPTAYIETVVLVKDTVWIKESNPIVETTKLVRDTVYIEVPAKAPTKWTSLEEGEEKQGDLEIVKTEKRPSQVEFIFGPKPLSAPTQKSNLIQFDSGVAKKTKEEKTGITTISINN